MACAIRRHATVVFANRTVESDACLGGRHGPKPIGASRRGEECANLPGPGSPPPRCSGHPAVAQEHHAAPLGPPVVEYYRLVDRHCRQHLVALVADRLGRAIRARISSQSERIRFCIAPLPPASDGSLLFAGLLFVLYHFGINITAALAGLGVGGIAVALAAQKTLENVIGGVSLIADQALRVGDFLSLGDVQGTVEDVGLRSTRIRTLERTLVSLPNGQIANMKLETISVRDKFWFHPVIGLRYETTPVQLRTILSNFRESLRRHPNVDPSSVRVRFIRFGAFSLDVDIFAYASADDWSNFLEIQEELLFGIIDVVHMAGAGIAFPSQTTYLATDGSDKLGRLFASAGERREAEQVA